MNEDILRAVNLLRASPDLQDDAIYRALVSSGMSRKIAARLVEFLPIVYSRLILRNSGARFSDTFHRSLSADVSREQVFSSDPVWRASVAFAKLELKRGVSAQDLISIAMRSSEFDAANRLLNSGSRLQSVVFSAPVFTWPEAGPRSEGE